MVTYLASLVALTAALAGAGPDPSPLGSFETPADLTPQGKIDELVFAGLKQLGIRAGQLVLRRRVRPPRLSGRDRHAAHGGGGPAVSARITTPNKRARADRPPAGAGRVCRLLGDEVERSAAGQGGVPHQPVAQRGAGLSPLDPRPASGRTCPTTGSSARCSPPAAAISACRQVNFYRAMQSREPQAMAQAVALTLHGRAGREMAEGAIGRHGGLLLPGRLQDTRRNGKRRSSSSIPARPRPRPACRAVFPDGTPVQALRRTRTRARSLPIG